MLKLKSFNKLHVLFASREDRIGTVFPNTDQPELVNDIFIFLKKPNEILSENAPKPVKFKVNFRKSELFLASIDKIELIYMAVVFFFLLSSVVFL